MTLCGNGSQPTGRGTARSLICVLLLFALLATALASVASPEPAGACVGTTDIERAERAAEDRFVTQLNRLRASKGLSSLVSNGSIAHASDQWSAVMAVTNLLSHDPNFFSIVSNLVSGIQRAAENVGRSGMSSTCTVAELDAAVARTVDSLHNAFVNSRGHYLNMVGPYNQVGTGVELHNGTLWVTVRFANGSLPVVATESTRRYLDAVYQLFVGRYATSGDDDRWAAAVQSGNRAAVTRALAVSHEWAGVRVTELYRTILGRSPDASGLRYWLGRVTAGLRLEDVAAGFYSSDEYFRRQGNTNRAFVQGLYRDILGRSPDASGLSYWVAVLNRGHSRYTVAGGFYASIESRRDRVRTLYREVLGRTPDAGGWAYWADQLRTIGDVNLAAYLASSAEFYRRATA